MNLEAIEKEFVLSWFEIYSLSQIIIKLLDNNPSLVSEDIEPIYKELKATDWSRELAAYAGHSSLFQTPEPEIAQPEPKWQKVVGGRWKITVDNWVGTVFESYIVNSCWRLYDKDTGAKIFSGSQPSAFLAKRAVEKAILKAKQTYYPVYQDE